jgi:hypothetical protein
MTNQYNRNLTVTVVSVTSNDRHDFINLSCRHYLAYDHDEANATLVGAEFVCKQAHEKDLHMEKSA